MADWDINDGPASYADNNHNNLGGNAEDLISLTIVFMIRNQEFVIEVNKTMSTLELQENCQEMLKQFGDGSYNPNRKIQLIHDSKVITADKNKLLSELKFQPNDKIFVNQEVEGGKMI